MDSNVFVEIVEQPAKIVRFRDREEGSAEILGASSIRGKRQMFPAFRVMNYTGYGVVIVSCVSKHKPYRPHPNKLVGNDGCSNGICEINFYTDRSAPTEVVLHNVGIQLCIKNEVEEALSEREALCVDPFYSGFWYESFSNTEKNCVRLCFQVFLKFDGTENAPIQPVVTNAIYNEVHRSKLHISEISDLTSPTVGGKKIIIICDKVAKDDIKIRFYREGENNSVEWEAWAHLNDVHGQTAIVFTTPAYATNNTMEPVSVLVQLVRPSDGWHSESRFFRYVPDYSSVEYVTASRKRKRDEYESTVENPQGCAEEQGQHCLKTDMMTNFTHTKNKNVAQSHQISSPNLNFCPYYNANPANLMQDSQSLSQNTFNIFRHQKLRDFRREQISDSPLCMEQDFSN